MKTNFLKQSITLMAAGLLTLGVYSCDSKTNSGNDAVEETGEAADAIGDQAEETMDNVAANFDTEKDEWEKKIEDRIDKLNTDMSSASADAKVKMQEKIDKLNLELDKVENSTEDSWNTVKSEVSDSYNKIENDVDNNM